MSGEICREATDYFRQQDYARGLTLVTTRVAQRYAQEFGFTLDSTLVRSRPIGGQREVQVNPLVVFLVIMVLIWLMSKGRGGRGGRGGGGGGFVPIILPSLGGGGWGSGGGWGGGGGGGGGGGFGGFGGGGGFSGGGGGSEW